MATDVPHSAGFFAELRRRRVLRVVGFYAISVWLVLQVSNIVFPALYLPPWALTVVVVAIAAGFPIVAVLAWVFDLTPQGLVRTGPAEPDMFGDPDVAIMDRPRIWIDIVIIGVLLAMIAYLLIEPAQRSHTSPPRTASIAVLPFLNLSVDPNDAFIGDALAEDIIHHLAQIAALKVAARTSSWAWRDRDADIPQIARALHVDSVLEGTVMRDPNGIRLTLQLIQGSTGYHLWSRTFTRPFEEIFRIKEEIATLTAESLGVELTPELSRQIARPATSRMDAYELYLRGLEYAQRPHQFAVRDIAIEQFEQALALDPRFAAAHAAVCDAYLYRYADHRAPTDFERAERACHRALTLAPDLPEARLSLGQLYRRSGQYDLAEEEVRAAMRMRPSADATLSLAMIFSETGRADEAAALYTGVLQSDPGYWVAHYQAGLFHYFRHEYGVAAERFRWVIRLVPDAPHGYNMLSASLFMAGNLEEALPHAERALAIEPSRSVLTRVGLLQWYLHDFAAAAATFRRAIDVAPDDFRSWCRLGMVLRHLPGMDEEATRVHRRGIELGLAELAVNPRVPETLARLGHCYAGAGDRERAEAQLELALHLAPDSATENFFAAAAYAVLGDAQRATHYLSRSEALGYSSAILERDPDLHEARLASSR